MRIQLVTPAPPGSKSGNRITAARWQRLLRELGHRVQLLESFSRRHAADVLIALHARKSYPAIVDFRNRMPGKPLVVGLAGTDLYRDLPKSARARQALAWADRIVTLQPTALDDLSPELRDKTRAIYQSAVPATGPVEKSRRTFDVCVVGHLRPVKDPFRTAMAARRLPAESRLRVLHAGRALSLKMRVRAEHEMAANPRYRWLGPRAHWQIKRLLSRCHAMVISSRLEGGANVISEAVVAGTPVIASRIAGSVGMLGEDHPALFEPGSTRELAALLERCETDPAFLAALAKRSRRLAPRFTPEREMRAWKKLLDELT